MLDGGYEEDCRGGGVVGRNGLGRRTGDAEDGPRVYLKMGVGLGLAKGKETRKGHACMSQRFDVTGGRRNISGSKRAYVKILLYNGCYHVYGLTKKMYTINTVEERKGAGRPGKRITAHGAGMSFRHANPPWHAEVNCH